MNVVVNNFILRRKRGEWLPKSPEPEAHVKTFDSNSRSNWNLEMLFFKEGGKTGEYPEKNPRSKDEN